MADQPWTWENSRVIHVVDGDTMDVRLQRDLGFHGIVVFEQRVRLQGINAPALKSERGMKAFAFVNRWLTWPTDNPLRVITHKPYKYGDEWMAEIINPVSGESLADALVKNELAVPWTGHGPRPDDKAP